MNRPIPPATQRQDPPANTPANTTPTEEEPEDGLGANEATVSQRLTAIRDSLETQTMSEAGARRVAQRMERARNRRRPLGPVATAETWYIEMLAQVQLDDDPEVCRTSRRVLQLSSRDDYRKAAQAFRLGRDCTP